MAALPVAHDILAHYFGLDESPREGGNLDESAP